MVNRFLAALLLLPASAWAELPPVAGFMWQLHEQMADARGSWHRLGARELILQWAAVDGIAYVPGLKQRLSARMPDWERIAREPWAERVIVGLSGRMDEQTTRRSLPAMLEESLEVARLTFPFKVSGWYFPAEVDPIWKDAPKVLPPVLNKLPRPLWISVYDGEGIGAQKFAKWLGSWLPSDVNVLFQDGVGAHGRSVPLAREYADALASELGKARFAIMVEAFRLEKGKFRPATAAELRPQLTAFAGYRLYLFDGPHYVPDRVVEELVADPATGKARRTR